MECCCYLRNVQDLLADGRTPHERRFGETCKGPIIPFGALVKHLPNSERERDKARIHQFGKKVIPVFFVSDMLWSRGEFGKETFWLQTLRSWKSWMHEKHFPEDWMRKKSWESKKMDNLFLLWQAVQQNCQEEATDSKNPLWGGESTGKRENLKREPHGVREEFQPKETKDDEKTTRIFGLTQKRGKNFNYRHSIEPRNSTDVRDKHHSLFRRFHILNETPLRRNIRCGERIGEKPKHLRQKQIQVN